MKKNAKKVFAVFLILCLALYVPAVMAEDSSTDPANPIPIENPEPIGDDPVTEDGDGTDEGEPTEGSGEQGEPTEGSGEQGEPTEG
ncbi:MAG: hypothetical protein GX351_00465, partial [Peptococcaceae bacterium]|nr:hypothetical protein [Peptococcaceae bacterium]